MNTRKLGILGAGHIAEKMATTINGMEGYEVLAVGSRSIGKARDFASRFRIARAYGSYGELIADKDVELIYIATPHSFHYDHAMMCVEAGKPVICEKAFTANAAEAELLLKTAEEKGVFITEAIWTRYMPLSKAISELVRSGKIGKPHCLTANLNYVVAHKERIQKPELAGGALLDIGIYTLNFAAMVFGSEVERTVSCCSKTETGVDSQETITQYFSEDRMAVLCSSIYDRANREGMISGDKGYITVQNINNPEAVRVYDKDDNLLEELFAPKAVTGFDYEVIASFKAIDEGRLECPEMPHAETLRMIRMMDDLRKEWGVVYPNDTRIL